MSRLRNQFSVKEMHQITSPEQLKEGMHIGVLDFIERPSVRERSLQILASFMLSEYRASNEGRLKGAFEAAKYTSPHGLLPQFTGFARNIGNDGLYVELARSLNGDLLEPDEIAPNPYDYLNCDPSELPLIHDRSTLLVGYSSIGLATGSDGRWEPTATILLPD